MTLGRAAPFSANQDIILALAERIVKRCSSGRVHQRRPKLDTYPKAEFSLARISTIQAIFIDFREADYHQLCLRTEGIQIDKI